MSAPTSAPQRGALGLSLAFVASILALPAGMLLAFSWFQGPSPLVAEAARWVYAPTSGTLLLGGVVGWLVAGRAYRRKRAQRARSAGSLLLIDAALFIYLATGAMRAEVVHVSFHNDSGGELQEVSVAVQDHEFQVPQMAPDQHEHWSVVADPEAHWEWRVQLSHSTEAATPQPRVFQGQDESASPELELRFTPTFDLIVGS